MQIIQLETKIAAPIERCFLLSLSIDLEMKVAKPARVHAIAGRTHGVIGPGETVTWRGRHLGLMMITHQSLITQYERPNHFQDAMLRGVFRSFVHDHFFAACDDGTVMRDRLAFAAPLAPISWFVERLVLRPYLTKLLKERNRLIRQVAEADEDVWAPFLKQSAESEVSGLQNLSR